MRGPRHRRNIDVPVVQIVILVAILGIWEIAARLRILDPFFFSQPSLFFGRALAWILRPDASLGGRSIYEHLFVTLEETMGGFVLGVTFGIAAGFFLGRSEFWS